MLRACLSNSSPFLTMYYLKAIKISVSVTAFALLAAAQRAVEIVIKDSAPAALAYLKQQGAAVNQ